MKLFEWLFPNNSRLETPISADNWVTARVWRATETNGRFISSIEATKRAAEGQACNVGHATVETNTRYLSHWPGERLRYPKKPVLSASQIQAHYQLPPLTPKDDEREEGRVADIQENFFSLDKEKIEEEIKKIQGEQYVLKQKTGGVGIIQGENCCSSTYRALQKGGIDKLSPECEKLGQMMTTAGFFAITPDDIARCVEAAKKEELRRYPQTAKYNRPASF